MKRRKFSKWNKEKVSIYASAALVLCVCVASGIYAGSQSPARKQIIDIASERPDESAKADTGESAAVPGEEQSQDMVAASTEDESLSIAAMEEAAKATEEAAANAPETGDMSAATDLTGDAELGAAAVSDDPKQEQASVETMGNPVASEPLTFSEGTKITWPIAGNILMPFSMEERIYFATLNEYCYFPAVIIEAAEGDNVVAAARGVVKEIGFHEEIGQYVVMDLGDGYQATYGQLDTVKCKEGKTVNQGKVIGTIAAPTKYYSLEGTNLYFKLEKDGTAVNPLLYFK